MYAFDINGVNITHANPGLSEYVIPKEAKFIQDGNETSYVFKDVCQSGKSFSISFEEGSQLTYIGAYACYKCSSLKEINFSNAKSLKYIINRAFSACNGLKSLYFPPSLEQITDWGCFNGCYGLKTVVFPDQCNLKSLASGSFRETGIQSFRVPAKCSYLNGETFGYSPLKEITVETGNTYFNAYENSLYTYDFQTLVFYCPTRTTFEINPKTTSIGRLAFEGYKYSLIIPNQIHNYNEATFINCQSTSIWMNHPPEIIKGSMFRGCVRLKTLFLFDTVKTIEANAFQSSTQLSFVFFLMPVSSISSSSFYHPEKICFSGNVTSIRSCLPNINIRECFLTIRERQTVSMNCLPNPFHSFIFLLLVY